MRLLTTMRPFELKSFIQDVPPYAILSHTWGEEEVTFDDLFKPYVHKMAGFQKIMRCCQQAAKDGYGYCWIDTCCIDKKSSAELSEAINSMYAYYQKADICYAYLADVSTFTEPLLPYGEFHSGYENCEAFERSRWFKRGWTLQELIAPQYVEFFSANWESIGTKHGLLEPIVQATKIAPQVLVGAATLNHYSIAQKFSWLAWRETTRKEDMAYCMLGIFDVHMPLIYGEGERAFVRLQEEIVKRSTDQTFLCWESEQDDDAYRIGPFCNNPRGFRNGGTIERDPHKEDASFVVTNRGLEIRLPCQDGPLRARRQTTLAFPSVKPRANNRIVILYWNDSNNVYWRVHSDLKWTEDKPYEREQKMMCIGRALPDQTTARVVRVASSIQLSSLYSSNNALAVQRIVLYTLQDGNIQILETKSSYEDFDLYEICYGEVRGFLIGDSLSSILFAFGFYFDGEFWFGARVATASADDIKAALISCSDESRQRYLGDPGWQDTRTFGLSNGYYVTVCGRRKRKQEFTYWDLEVHIATEPGPRSIAVARRTFHQLIGEAEKTNEDVVRSQS